MRTLLAILVLGSGPPGGLPYAGLPRVAFHLGEQAPFVAWPIGIAALSIHVIAKRPVWPIAFAYVALVAELVLGYPTVRRELLQSVYLAVTLAALAVSIGGAAAWWRAKRAHDAPGARGSFIHCKRVRGDLWPICSGSN